MKLSAMNACILSIMITVAPGLALAENPLFMPRAESGPVLMSLAEIEGLKKEAETLKRKAELLKTAATKKYKASSDLRKKAGGFRSESSQKGELLRSQAEQSADISGFIGEMFGIMSSMGGGQLSNNAAFASALTGKMIQGQQTMDANGVMVAQGKAGQMAMEADKKAGPLEMRADELDNEANRLMEAHNRLMGIVNAKSLLVAADELSRNIDSDSRAMELLKERTQDLVTSLVSH